MLQLLKKKGNTNHVNKSISHGNGPASITEVRSFHSLTFRGGFTNGRIIIAGSITDYLKKGKFIWGPKQNETLPDFDKSV